MLTKRKIILFLIVLAIMVLVKYAVGQDGGEAVGWDPAHTSYGGGGNLDEDIQQVLLFGTIVGIMSGAMRVFDRNIAARRGQYFTGDLICLHI